VDDSPNNADVRLQPKHTWLEVLEAFFNGILIMPNNLKANLLLLVHGELEAGEFLWFFPALFTSIWLWIYVGSGFMLKFARRFDVGFQWFNRRFDIEDRPLQSIGLAAGALVAVMYWAVVIVGRILG
jgi:hypothetical protein